MIISENTYTSYIRRTLAFGYEIGTKKCDLYTSNYGISGTVMSNFTFVDFFIAPVLLSYIMNAGGLRSYPMNVPSYERSSSLRLCLSTTTKHFDPKGAIFLIFGFLPVNSSYGVHAVRFWKHRFRVYPLVDNAYVHRFLGSLLSNNRHRAMSKLVLQLRSAVPFCCGVYGALRSCLTLKGPGIFTVFHVGANLKLQIGM